MSGEGKIVALGVPCGKCGETIFLFHGERPGDTHIVDLSLFTYAVGPKKGKTLHDNEAGCPANGCEWTREVQARTFNPRMWNEIRID